jgi:hypothetical protein
LSHDTQPSPAKTLMRRWQWRHFSASERESERVGRDHSRSRNGRPPGPRPGQSSASASLGTCGHVPIVKRRARKSSDAIVIASPAQTRAFRALQDARGRHSCQVTKEVRRRHVAAIDCGCEGRMSLAVHRSSCRCRTGRACRPGSKMPAHVSVAAQPRPWGTSEPSYPRSIACTHASASPTRGIAAFTRGNQPPAFRPPTELRRSPQERGAGQ